jgi:Txe/YoeB family toxin of toxin-antitoxin system
MFQVKYSKKAKFLVDLISQNPYQTPPPYEKLIGELLGKLSRRINVKHRLVYQVFEPENTIKIINLWSHYEF